MASAMAAVVPAAGIGGGKLYGTHPGGFSFVVALFSTRRRRPLHPRR